MTWYPNGHHTVPSAQEIEDAKTPAGGWTKDTLANWGVPWPPPKGWRKRLVVYGIRLRARKESERLKRVADYLAKP